MEQSQTTDLTEIDFRFPQDFYIIEIENKELNSFVLYYKF